ncbi:hypothetical protein PSYMO_30408 [Pseudomonas amygdali pv. mori str. 301020]|uniref:Uncharacterized protein n=1 Tax=Pseudomonas amygdali pv. mori str. 301020 TaxID=629261 RepID=A0A656GHD9_PSEA0|nr:hypothetical protein PSYMO_30408 [Pseudomonas amygdali pv. mori str. 301020]
MLLWRADADAQELGDTLLFEVTDDDALLTQFRSQGCSIVLRVAGRR